MTFLFSKCGKSLCMDTHIIEIKRAILINTTYNTGSQIIYHTENHGAAFHIHTVMHFNSIRILYSFMNGKPYSITLVLQKLVHLPRLAVPGAVKGKCNI